ncbi:MAG TPA: substrate-binding domain-containing protein, partial [Arenibacter sp.]|nr:substrate-binding domain-containing protein [Arenibacter sp.]
MIFNKNKGWHVLACLIILLSCQDRDKDGKLLDTPTSGEITIAADESLLPLVDAEIKAFEGIYKNAKINVIYGSERASINKLLQDSVRLALVNRPMMARERSILEGQRITPSTLKVGTGAIALIVNKDNPDSSISF